MQSMGKDQEVIQEVRLTKVVDGDTLLLLIPQPKQQFGIRVFLEGSCRLYGIDTPEQSTEAGKLVTKITQRLFPHWELAELTIIQKDKYAGRLDGLLVVKGINLSDYLIENKLAKPYIGGTRYWTYQELKSIEEQARIILSQTSYIYPYL